MLKKDNTPLWEGINIFSTIRNNTRESLVTTILDSMLDMGVDIITSNCEYAPGQMEIVWAPAYGIKAADDAFTIKNGVKEIVQKLSDCKEFATFMSKPWADKSGCG